ncbi:hypothetical protein N7510_006846 [Penicillium lagena]|uniref:uncharacterized protein n=1 Tax=Penicillium lagena TaxID=94218 RepID=UPI00253F76EB|nr:uncharacterized protein N7510_006846 [Penicillium lagena]KAJ5610127.1 hypothetical protein N7510_006846 [Penicillium lagena]
MSNHPPERPWSEEEKYALLTEILKKAGIPSSHLVRMIRDFQITPSWGDIPLPPGRSLNASQMAFWNMCQQSAQPSSLPVAPYPSRPEMPDPPAAPMDLGTARKRPLFPAEKPILAHRAIQPRPPVSSTASYSSESGASAAQVSPRLETAAYATGEPPRKRGRPSKAETERRKAAAEARGETYPPPRRSGSGRLTIPPSPTSPAAGASRMSMSTAPPAPQEPRPFEVPTARPGGAVPASGSDDRRKMPIMSSRELPRPTEMGHTLPSPRTLQLAPRDPFPRINSSQGDRPYTSFSHDRFSPPGSSSRHDSRTDPPLPPPPPGQERRMSTTPAEKQPQ